MKVLQLDPSWAGFPQPSSVPGKLLQLCSERLPGSWKPGNTIKSQDTRDTGELWGGKKKKKKRVTASARVRNSGDLSQRQSFLGAGLPVAISRRRIGGISTPELGRTQAGSL